MAVPTLPVQGDIASIPALPAWVVDAQGGVR